MDRDMNTVVAGADIGQDNLFVLMLSTHQETGGNNTL